MTESELADELDFTCSPSPVVQKTPPAKPKVSIRMNFLLKKGKCATIKNGLLKKIFRLFSHIGSFVLFLSLRMLN